MNKLYYKDPQDLKTNIDQLIGFVENATKGGEEEEKLVHSTSKVEDQNLKLLKMPSKYATILTCSFEKDQKMVLGGKLLP
ncbi:MAG: hypothetical protein MUO91_09005 [candidate division Zixibacteria bacterium]|nr:hypothetical protein [candidate division Zixibacteria bacterium]